MKKIILLISFLLAPMLSQAGLLVQNYNAAEKRPTNFGERVERPEFFNNNWFIQYGETAGYVSFEAHADFDAVMYLVAYDYNVTGNFGDVIAKSTPTGSYGRYGYNQKIEGFLDEITDKDGQYWSGYGVFVAPVGFTPEMLVANDYSFIDEYFSIEASMARANEGFQDSPNYTLIATYPTEITYDTPDRPEGVITLNEQYLASSAVSANVSEPAVASLLALALAGGFAARRKLKA